MTRLFSTADLFFVIGILKNKQTNNRHIIKKNKIKINKIEKSRSLFIDAFNNFRNWMEPYN